MRRLDIDSDIAEWISKNISDSYSIDDGSGLITYRDSKQLTGSHYLNFEIPRSANGSFLAHSEIIDALIDPAKKQNILNHISINKDTVLGFDKHGTAIRLNNVYSNATIESAVVVTPLYPVIVPCELVIGFPKRETTLPDLIITVSMFHPLFVQVS